MLVVMYVFLGLLGQAVGNVQGQECRNTVISNGVGKVSYYPAIKPDGSVRKCSWMFTVPHQRQFLLLFEFLHLRAYENDDEIALPDGSVLPRQAVLRGSTPVCRTFTLPMSGSTECVAQLSYKYCPGQLPTISLHPTNLTVSTVPRSRKAASLYYFTSFQMQYTYYYCPGYLGDTFQNQPSASGNGTLVSSTATSVTTILLALLLVIALIVIAFLIWIFLTTMNDATQKSIKEEDATVGSSLIPLESAKPPIVPLMDEPTSNSNLSEDDKVSPALQILASDLGMSPQELIQLQKLSEQQQGLENLSKFDENTLPADIERLLQKIVNEKENDRVDKEDIEKLVLLLLLLLSASLRGSTQPDKTKREKLLEKIQGSIPKFLKVPPRDTSQLDSKSVSGSLTSMETALTSPPTPRSVPFSVANLFSSMFFKPSDSRKATTSAHSPRSTKSFDSQKLSDSTKPKIPPLQWSDLSSDSRTRPTKTFNLSWPSKHSYSSKPTKASHLAWATKPSGTPQATKPSDISKPIVQDEDSVYVLALSTSLERRPLFTKGLTKEEKEKKIEKNEKGIDKTKDTRGDDTDTFFSVIFQDPYVPVQKDIGDIFVEGKVDNLRDPRTDDFRDHKTGYDGDPKTDNVRDLKPDHIKIPKPGYFRDSKTNDFKHPIKDYRPMKDQWSLETQERRPTIFFPASGITMIPEVEIPPDVKRLDKKRRHSDDSNEVFIDAETPDYRQYIIHRRRRFTWPLVTIPPSINPSRTAKRVSLHFDIDTGSEK